MFYPGADGSLEVWDMDRQEERGRLLAVNDARITDISAWGNFAVSTQVDGPPRLWNLEAFECTATLPDMPDMNSTYCTESRVLLGSIDGPIKLWDIATSAPVALPDLEGHDDAVVSMKASASMVLSSSGDKTMRLWDLRSGMCVRTMEGHAEHAWSVDMDGHCRTAVSGSADATVKLWDLGTGRCISTFEGHSKAVRDVVMHESGSSFLSSGGDDGTVIAWSAGSSRASMRADLTAISPVIAVCLPAGICPQWPSVA